MPKTSAGLLMYRTRDRRIEVLLAHPGGPFFRNKDEGAWSIPKGEIDPDEDQLAAAQREFQEETSLDPNAVKTAGAPFLDLGRIKQKGGKVVRAWAFEGDCDPAEIRSNTFTLEWPPRSGRQQQFPEIDRAAFFPLDEARRKINAAQATLLDSLKQTLAGLSRPSRRML
jgi:predicted NUDIX family NTP pyrophosphohydrolase